MSTNTIILQLIMTFFFIIAFLLIILFLFCRLISFIIRFLCCFLLIFTRFTFIQECSSFIQTISQYKITKYSTSLHLPYFNTNITNRSSLINIFCFHIFWIINLRMYPWTLIFWIWNLLCPPNTFIFWIINLWCLPFTILLIIPIIRFCCIWTCNRCRLIIPIIWLCILWVIHLFPM